MLYIEREHAVLLETVLRCFISRGITNYHGIIDLQQRLQEHTSHSNADFLLYDTDVSAVMHAISTAVIEDTAFSELYSNLYRRLETICKMGKEQRS